MSATATASLDTSATMGKLRATLAARLALRRLSGDLGRKKAPLPRR